MGRGEGGLYTLRSSRVGIVGMFVLCQPRGYPRLFASDNVVFASPVRLTTLRGTLTPHRSHRPLGAG